MRTPISGAVDSRLLGQVLGVEGMTIDRAIGIVAAEGQRPKPKLVLRGWKPLRRGTLVGFASITLPIGLEIDDVAVFVSGSRRWVNLPAKPLFGADGQPLRDDKGRQKYLPILRWGGSHGLNARFGEAVIGAIEAEHGPLGGGEP